MSDSLETLKADLHMLQQEFRTPFVRAGCGEAVWVVTTKGTKLFSMTPPPRSPEARAAAVAALQRGDPSQLFDAGSLECGQLLDRAGVLLGAFRERLPEYLPADIFEGQDNPTFRWLTFLFLKRPPWSMEVGPSFEMDYRGGSIPARKVTCKQLPEVSALMITWLLNRLAEAKPPPPDDEPEWSDPISPAQEAVARGPQPGGPPAAAAADPAHLVPPEPPFMGNLSPEKLREMFLKLRDAAANHASMAPAFGVWLSYPENVGIILFNVRDPDQRYMLWSELNFAHREACRRLMTEAVREGIDLRRLAQSQEICERLHAKCKLMVPRHPDRLYDTWPDCVSDGNDELTAEERTTIRAAHADLLHLARVLEVKMEAQPQTTTVPHAPAGPDGRQCGTPAEAPPASDCRCRLQVDGNRVLLDGAAVPLDMPAESRGAALCLLRHLLAAGGDWRSSTELDEMEFSGACREHAEVRWDRVRKKLPFSVQHLIETNRRKGARLIRAAWHR
jgi:hypothetical protein